MTTISIQDRMAQSIERMNKEYHEKFKKETLEILRQRREAKEQKDKEAGQPANVIRERSAAE